MRRKYVLVDARSKEEYEGTWFVDGPPTSGQNAGHILGAIHIPFQFSLDRAGRFKRLDELRTF